MGNTVHKAGLEVHFELLKMLRIFLLVAAMAVVARCGEVTKMLETLDGYDHFSGIRVYVDDCAEGKPVNKDDGTPDVCNLEGFEYPCCHVARGTEVKGHMTMVSEEDTLDNGLITCRVGVGAQLAETCIVFSDHRFGQLWLNTTCPVSGPTPVSYDFSF